MDIQSVFGTLVKPVAAFFSFAPGQKAQEQADTPLHPYCQNILPDIIKVISGGSLSYMLQMSKRGELNGKALIASGALSLPALAWCG